MRRVTIQATCGDGLDFAVLSRRAHLDALDVRCLFTARYPNSEFRNPSPQAIAMRLTLRTLLALRDGVLDRQDSVELEQRLRQSSTAQAIEKRIQGVIADRKIPGMPADERGFAQDANDVARFLDDSLPVDRVPDFERKCLENNAILSEVAACHEILTRAVQDTVPISFALRAKIYGLHQGTSQASGIPQPTPALDSNLGRSSAEPLVTAVPVSREDDSHPIASGPHSATHLRRSSEAMKSEQAGPHRPTSADTSEKGRKPPSAVARSGRTIGGVGIELNDLLGKQVPEYLQVAQRYRFATLAKIGALLLLLSLTSMMAVGPWKRVAALLGKKPNESSASASTDLSEPTNLQATAGNNQTVQNQPAVQNQPLAKQNTPAEQDSIAQPAEETAPPDSMPFDAPPEDPVTSPNSNGTETDRTEREPASGSLRKTAIDPSTEGLVLWQRAKQPGHVTAWLTPDEGARLLAPQSLTWKLILNRNDQPIPPDTPWFLLPGAHNEIVCKDGMRWILKDDAELRLLKSSTGLLRAQVIARNALIVPSRQSKRFEVQTPSGTIEVLIDSDSSVAGLETDHHRVVIDTTVSPPGIYPAWHTNIIAVEGSLDVRLLPTTDGKGIAGNVDGNLNSTADAPALARVKIKKSEEVTFDDGHLSPPQLSDVPWPIKTSNDEEWELATLLSSFQPTSGKPSWEASLASLAASTSDANKAALAIRANVQLGKFDRLFGPDGVFQRSELQKHWPLIIDQIYRSLAVPEHAGPFLSALKEQSAERLPQMLKLLSAPTAAELESGADKFLVDSLSDSLIDVRAIAIYRLTAITGVDFGYDAMVPTAGAIQQWKTALASERIRLPRPVSANNSDLH